MKIKMILQDFYNGTSFDAYKFFGAHIENGAVVFRTYAPNAEKIYVTGSFNDWGREEMQQQAQSGVFSVCIESAKAGDMYKYIIVTKAGNEVYHCDPYGFGMELRPNTASYIVDLSEYVFNDETWMAGRDKNYNRPVNIYEAHLGSWMTNNDDKNGWYNYSEIAESIIPYLTENNFTHIELLPLSEHPADCSWGYQVSGFYSPTSRYGTARQLMEFVDKCHQSGIGVIMDFVPVHFACDDYGLGLYDGTALYEYPSYDIGASEWGTRNFNPSRREVCCFIQSCANYWLTEYHFDGLRMDAISRLLYWQGDPKRGVNSNAVKFLQNMNSGLQKRHPTAMLIAEDSTSYSKVTAPVEYDGLGFDYKWDLGWMNDTLEYFKLPPKERPAHDGNLTFSMHYFYNEHYIMPLSHDETVHGKATVIQKMWGGYGEKFRQARAFYLYMFAHPGKKLNFMGNEIGQFREWDEKRQPDWELLQYPLHDAFHRYFKDLGKLYLTCTPLYNGEHNPFCFQWITTNLGSKPVYIFERGTEEQKIIAAFNFSDEEAEDIALELDKDAYLEELICSEDEIYGGTIPHASGCINAEADERDNTCVAKFNLPGFSGKLFLVGRSEKDG